MSKTVRKYAQVVNPQINPNLPKRENWSKIGNAVGSTDLLASSLYTVKFNKKDKVVGYNYPYKVTAHDFRFNIPSNAYIKEIKFGVRMKCSTSKMGASYPSVGFYIKDKKSSVKDSKKNKTGWHDGIYWAYSDKSMSKSLYTEEYVMNESNYKKGGFDISDINSTYFGVDLNFAEEPALEHTIYLKWIWCEITYDVPQFTLTSNYAKHIEEDPKALLSGQTYDVQFTLKQSTKAYGGTRNLKLNIPFGTDIVGNVAVSKGSFNTETNTWTLNTDGVTEATLKFKMADYTIDKQSISLVGNTSTLKSEFWYYTSRGTVGASNYIRIEYATATRPHKRHTTCYAVTSTVNADITQVVYSFANTKRWDVIRIDMDEGVTDSEVILDHIDYNASISEDGSYPKEAYGSCYAYVNIPANKTVNVGFTVCLRPKETGDNTFMVRSFRSDTGIGFADRNHEYSVADPYVYHFGQTASDTDNVLHQQLLTNNVKITTHRITTDTETDAKVLPCSVKDGDALMIQSHPNIHMYLWEQIDYIGCVPIEHYHFDPKSTYKDKLLDTHYKNRRYMGKELAPDEDITLNIRLHPKQVTTIQGLIDMDKPIPINANHKTFEGDALNHRGWAEIYSISTTKTNPSWYKCDIDVKYLTHNLNSRFHIQKGGRTFSKYTMPSLLTTINDTGDRITNGDETDFFIVDTDGTYNYIGDSGAWVYFFDENGDKVKWTGDTTTLTVTEEDGTVVTYTGEGVLVYLEEIGLTVETPTTNQYIKVREEYITANALRNHFTLDEGQHISIKSKEKLSTITQISFNWLSSKLNELKENAISRIVRLIDADTDDVVFEYEWCDFDFEDFVVYDDDETQSTESILSCRVIGRRYNGSDYEALIDEMIDLANDVETTDDEYIDSETGEQFAELKYFGSNLIFDINNNTLKIIDEGYNGKEIERTVELEGKQYYYETYWQNNNVDGEDADIDCYLDLVVQDSVLNSEYASKYSSMYVSPFPVSDKKIIFTRNAEEGVLYYLDDNKEEFTYLIDPYYQYHNGVDLRTESEDGEYISIFNLNYGYKVIYLENGLVSLGINRLNGKMYLRKYDPVSKTYIKLFDLHLNKFDDININSISDDRIELQASDTTIIMYRGHPYVIFKHELEDIGIDTKSNKVWGQSVDGDVHLPYPVMFDLMNHENMLPACVTGKLDDDCVQISKEYLYPSTDVNVTITKTNPSDVEVGDTVTFSATGQPSGSKVCFLIKKDDWDGFDEVGCTTTGSFSYNGFKEVGAYQVMAVYVGDDTHSYSISNELSVLVTAEPSVTPLTGSYKLDINCASTMRYMGGEKIVFTLTQGGVPVSGKTIEVVDFNAINTEITDANGQAIIYNNNAKNHPKTYSIQAKYWEGGSVKVASKTKKVKMNKGSTKFEVNHGAEHKGSNFSVKLRTNYKVNNKYSNIANRKITITANGVKKDKTTNNKGNASLKINDKGTTKYVCVFNGDKDYESTKLTYREFVGD